MLRTITIGSCISVQGMFIKMLENGKVVVRVGEKTFTGRPVETGKRAARGSGTEGRVPIGNSGARRSRIMRLAG